ILLVVVVGLVGGISFLSQWNVRRQTGETPVDGPEPVVAGRLVFFSQDGVPGANVREERIEHELALPGQRDFWFENAGTAPATLLGKFQSCACSNVSVGVLPPAWREFSRAGIRTPWAATQLSAVTGLVAPGRSFDLVGAGTEAILSQVRWQPLNIEEG